MGSSYGSSEQQHTLTSVVEALLITKEILYAGLDPYSSLFQASQRAATAHDSYYHAGGEDKEKEKKQKWTRGAARKNNPMFTAVGDYGKKKKKKKKKETEPAIDGRRRANTSSCHQRPLGTLLTPISNPFAIEAFDCKADVVCTAEEGDPLAHARASPEAVRKVEIFLDLLGALVSNCTLYILDERFQEALTEEEVQFSEHLHGCLEQLKREPEVTNMTHAKPFQMFFSELTNALGMSGREVVNPKAGLFVEMVKKDLIEKRNKT
eukprot:jgi/Bigna1/82538/fgenesh1_pg.93_\